MEEKKEFQREVHRPANPSKTLLNISTSGDYTSVRLEKNFLKSLLEAGGGNGLRGIALSGVFTELFKKFKVE